ncbi:MAG: molybdenum-dependent transcriptional regulator [Alphaproteobacteria bacterium CG_4_10_14_0_2_um_filter_63_37]|nr:MAG: hypothetical protein AUJ55_13140 [Proteobacteria bacterium CG1_02_64_396]PJA25182.1 MAG: molybdenum-dependent transcriptional regulator [Alphaproteobacteria bacterium CG_4_10_14_0_2_um_filter_63_37]
MNQPKAAGRIWLDQAGQGYAGSGRIDLLEAIEREGSISAAARALGMSYKGAWDAIDAMNNLAPNPLVARSVGGKHGGGTRITAEGRRLIEVFRVLEKEHETFVARLGAVLHAPDAGQVLGLMRRVQVMRTSARNQWLGTVERIDEGPVSALVTVRLKGEDRIQATVTRESAHELGLQPGVEVVALLKAPFVMLAAADATTPKVSAANGLRGVVSRVVPGAVNVEVTLNLDGGNTLVSVVTRDGLAATGLKEGDRALALFDPGFVILGLGG